jgi:hypothetical protein
MRKKRMKERNEKRKISCGQGENSAVKPVDH